MAKRFDLKSVLAPVAIVIRRLKDRRTELLGEVAEIEERLSRFEGHEASNGRKVRSDAGTKRKAKQGRRSRDEIVKHARGIVEYIKAGGKDGRSGQDIKKTFGQVVPSVKLYLAQYVPDVKLKTTGERAAMKYTI